MLEVIQTIGAYNKAKHIPVDIALATKSITDALSAKYKQSKLNPIFSPALQGAR